MAFSVQAKHAPRVSSDMHHGAAAQPHPLARRVWACRAAASGSAPCEGQNLPQQQQQASGSASRGGSVEAAGSTGACSRRASLAAGVASAVVAAWPMRASAAPPAPARPFCGVVDTLPLWSYSADWQEGLVDYAGFSTWYRALGKPYTAPKKRKARRLPGSDEPADKLPVLVLHGGPGMPSRYLESLELLGAGERRLVFYDQVGCGQSRRASQGKGPALARITPELFVREVHAIRQALGLERVHLVGHGWGGMLALAYLTTPTAAAARDTPAPSLPLGVASLTLLSTPPTWDALVRDRREKAQALGPGVWSVLEQGDGAAEAPPGYEDAWRQYERAHVVTGGAEPGCLRIARAGVSPSIQKGLAGGRLFQVGGTLAGWRPIQSAEAQLPPALVVRGTQEELSISSTQELLASVSASSPAGAKLVELPGGTMVHVDAHEALLRELDAHFATTEFFDA